MDTEGTVETPKAAERRKMRWLVVAGFTFHLMGLLSSVHAVMRTREGCAPHRPDSVTAGGARRALRLRDLSP